MLMLPFTSKHSKDTLYVPKLIVHLSVSGNGCFQKLQVTKRVFLSKFIATVWCEDAQ